MLTLTQLSFADLEYEDLRKKKRTRWQHLFDEMEAVLPWEKLEAPLGGALPQARQRTPPPIPLSILLRSYCMPQWLGRSDPAMEDVLYEVPSARRLAGVP